jgi:hypothetical protein
METKTTTTYSMWSLFRNCRKACEWRYIQELVPLERDHNLAFGTVIHKCLEIWHGGRDLGLVLDFIDRTYPNRAQEEDQKREWHLAAAISTGCWHYASVAICAMTRSITRLMPDGRGLRSGWRNSPYWPDWSRSREHALYRLRAMPRSAPRCHNLGLDGPLWY